MSLQIINQIEELRERTAENDRDIEAYGKMIDGKKMTNASLEQRVEKLEIIINKETNATIQQNTNRLDF